METLFFCQNTQEGKSPSAPHVLGEVALGQVNLHNEPGVYSYDPPAYLARVRAAARLDDTIVVPKHVVSSAAHREDATLAILHRINEFTAVCDASGAKDISPEDVRTILKVGDCEGPYRNVEVVKHSFLSLHRLVGEFATISQVNGSKLKSLMRLQPQSRHPIIDELTTEWLAFTRLGVRRGDRQQRTPLSVLGVEDVVRAVAGRLQHLSHTDATKELITRPYMYAPRPDLWD